MSVQTVEVSRDDVVDALCKMIRPIVKLNALPPEDCNKYGVDVLYSKTDPALFMLHWITPDMLEINMEFDMMDLKRLGKQYIESRMELIQDQLKKARAERQQANRITINDVQRETIEPKPVAAAVSGALH